MFGCKCICNVSLVPGGNKESIYLHYGEILTKYFLKQIIQILVITRPVLKLKHGLVALAHPLGEGRTLTARK